MKKSDRQPRRRILSAKITRLALCPRGMNEMPVLYKADDKTVQLGTIVKGMSDAGEVTAIVYAKDRTDAEGDIASADVIKAMAYDCSLRGLADIEVMHGSKALPREKAFVAESFLVSADMAKHDTRFNAVKDYNNKPVNTEDAWVTVTKINDEALRKEYREGKWNGISMYGPAEIELLKTADQKAENSARKLLKAMGLGMLLKQAEKTEDNDTPSKGTDMEPTAVQKMIDDSLKANNAIILAEIQKTNLLNGVSAEDKALVGILPTDIVEVVVAKLETLKLKKAQTTPAKKNLRKAQFAGDPTDEKARRSFEYVSKKGDILASMDRTDAASVEAASVELVELKKEYADVVEAVEAAAAAATSAFGASAQGLTGGGAGTVNATTAAKLAKTGDDIAKYANEFQGMPGANQTMQLV